jgi:phytoene dehydrogenase-like protein
MLGQHVGWPVPVGGAGELTAALVRRLEDRGGKVRCGAPVEQIVVEGGRARGVAVSGTALGARRAVVADVDAGVLFRRLVGAEHLRPSFLSKLDGFEQGWPTIKVDWALRSPIPWTDPDVAGAGTVHVAGSLDELTLGAAELAAGRLPTEPFLIMGQMTTTDPTRSPAGTESAWAYTHVPATVRDGSGRRPLSGGDVAETVRRIEQRVEDLAPGFRDLILARHVAGPADLEAANANLVGGDIGGGTYQLHQQLVFRPFPGLGRPETPIPGLYLGSASAHPGGGVHGACGANAAKAALARHRLDRTTAALTRRGQSD